MNVTTTIIWNHRGRVSRDKKGMVEVRVTWGRRPIYIGTGIRCMKSEFAAGRIVNCPGVNELNHRLSIIYSKVLACVNACVEKNVAPDAAEIRKEVFRTEEAVSDEPLFLDWVEKQIPVLPISEGTRKHYYPLLARLHEYAVIRKWKDVTVANIMGLDAYLRTVTKPMSDAEIKRKKKPEKLSDAGIYNYHKCLKALLNRALLMGMLERNPYERLKGKIKRGERENVEYLTEDEMTAFESLSLPEGSALDIARDLFVFQMYTGLSFTDAQAFDIGNYKWDGDSWKHTGERIKTGVPYVSRLLSPAVSVLEKYGWSVPKINNADYNRHLKALGQMAGIKTTLHSHLARHTFATWMLRNGAKIENVSRMLGHTNITQTQRYAKVLAESVHDDFSAIEKKLLKRSRSAKRK